MIDHHKILEDVKKLLKDLDKFFNVTLKKEKLKKDANIEKETLYARVKETLSKLTEDEEIQEEYVDVAIPGSQPEDCDQTYDDTAPISDMTDAISHSGSQRSENDEENDDDKGDLTYAGTEIRPKSVAQLGTASKEGTLDKKRKDGQFGFSNWQSRYCVIKDNILYYYKTKTDSKQCNEISLTGYEATSSPDLDKKHKRKQFLFVLIQPGSRSFQFIAQSHEDMMSWIDEINIASKLCPKPEPAVSIPAGDGDDFGDEYEDLGDYQKFKSDQINSKGADDKKVVPAIQEDFGEEYEDLGDYQRFKLEQASKPADATTASKVPAFETANEEADFGDEYEDLDEYQKMKIDAVPQKVEKSGADFGDTYDDVSVNDTPLVPPQRGILSKPVPPIPAESQGSGSSVVEFNPQSDDENDCGDIYEEVAGQKVDKPKRFGNSVIHSPLPAPPPRDSSASPPVPSRKLPAPPPSGGSSTPSPPVPKKQDVIPEKEPWEDDIHNIYIGMWDCKADERNELEFRRGDFIHILNQDYGGWWVGERNYKVGLVPKEYLMKAYM